MGRLLFYTQEKWISHIPMHTLVTAIFLYIGICFLGIAHAHTPSHRECVSPDSSSWFICIICGRCAQASHHKRIYSIHANTHTERCAFLCSMRIIIKSRWCFIYVYSNTALAPSNLSRALSGVFASERSEALLSFVPHRSSFEICRVARNARRAPLSLLRPQVAVIILKYRGWPIE